jgi:hypothetical protein
VFSCSAIKLGKFCYGNIYRQAMNLQNVMVEWLALLIREVPGSNLDPEAGYPD